MTDHEAYIALNLTQGIGPARATLLCQIFGSASEIFQHTADEIATVHGISSALAENILASAGAPLQRELELIERSNVQVLTLSDYGYPEPLRAIEDPPICLYVCGTLPEELAGSSVAIVGSRRATVYGMRMAQHLAESAACAGWVVVSGLAAGVDTAAHKGTVGVNGKTVAVLGGGLMKIQPQENIELARSILEMNGAVISEHPMLFPPTRHSFPMRNRIISALSVATIVVEAGSRSGALITAATATDQGKQVFAVPGNADNEMSVGCNELIKSGGAALLTSFEDVLSAADFLPGFELKEDPAPFRLEEFEDDSITSESDRKVLDYLRKEGDSQFDSISLGTGISAGELSRKLIALEISHRIQRLSNGSYRRLR